MNCYRIFQNLTISLAICMGIVVTQVSCTNNDSASQQTSMQHSEDLPLSVVEEMPEFPGGKTEMLTYLQKNVAYPQTARQNGIEGKVYVQFVVEKDGSITHVTVPRGIGAGCDEEAKRVVQSMPAWNVGKQNGQPVRVQITLPIQFKLA